MTKYSRSFLLCLIIFLLSTSLGYGEEIKILEGHRSPISDFCLTYSKNSLISMDSEGKIKFWSLSSYKVTNEFNIYNAPYFTHIDISNSGRYIALSADEVLWVFDILKKSVIKKINGIESMGLFAGGENLLYLRDGYINILDLYKNKSERIRFAYPPPENISISSSRSYLALWGKGYLIIFDLKEKNIIRKIKKDVLLFSFLGDNKFLFYTENGLFIDNINGKNPVALPDIDNVEYVKGSYDGTKILISTPKNLYIYKIEHGKIKKEISEEFGPIQKWVFTSKNISAFLPLGSNEIVLVSSADLSAIANLGGYSLPVDKIRFSYSGDYLIAGLKDKDTYLLRVYDIKHHTFVENDLFSSCIDFEASTTSEKIAVLDPNYDLYIYNLKNHEVEKLVPEVRDELLLFKKNLIYTFFDYNNLGIYNINNGSFESMNLNSMPFLPPIISPDGTIATLGEDGNVWIYIKGKKPKKIELPDEVKERLQAEELGITIPEVVFTGKRGELILSIPEENSGFIIEKIENYRSRKKLKLDGPIIGVIEHGKYYLQEVTLPDTGKVVLNLLNTHFKKMKSIEMDDALISSYDYAKGFLIAGDYGGTIKVVKIKTESTLTIKIFNDGNWIIMNNKGEFSAGKGIDKYLDLTPQEISRRYKEGIMEDFFK